MHSMNCTTQTTSTKHSKRSNNTARLIYGRQVKTYGYPNWFCSNSIINYLSCNRVIFLDIMHIKKYRYEYGQSITCLIHSMKIFALTFQSTLLVTLRAIYRQRKNSISNHTTKTKQNINKTITKVLATKQKGFEVQRCECAESDRWNANSRESTDKELSKQKYDQGIMDSS